MYVVGHLSDQEKMCHLHDLLCLPHAVIVTCKSLTTGRRCTRTACQLCNRDANLGGAGVIQSLVRELEVKWIVL